MLRIGSKETREEAKRPTAISRHVMVTCRARGMVGTVVRNGCALDRF